MKKILIVSFFLLAAKIYSQNNIGIGTNNPHASATLEMADNQRGILIPRVALSSTTVSAPVANPANSLLVYNTNTAGDVTPGYYYWEAQNNRWVRLLTEQSNDWKQDGNSNGALRYIGTNDNFDFPIATNGIERMRVTTAGNVGVGTNNPHASATLEMADNQRGILIPRVALSSTTVSAPVANPANSLLVYNTNTAGDVTPGYYYWEAQNNRWVRLLTEQSNDWKQDGNSNGALRYIGTNDNFDFPIATNGVEKMRVTVAGNVGVGTLNPTARFHTTGTVRLEGYPSGPNGAILHTDNSGNLGITNFTGNTTHVLRGDGTFGPVPLNNALPPGAIIMYSGAWNFDATGLGTGTLTGWALCNGNNGTPNLQDRFVMGTVNSVNLNSTGGNNSYTLTAAQLPAHTHGIRAIFHGQDTEGSDNCVTPGVEQRVFFGDDNIWPNCGNPSRVTYPTDATGNSDPIDNRPAYIQLAFIMKL